MQPRQFFSGRCEGGEIGRKRNPRQLALEISCVPLAIPRMMEQRVDVVEDVFLRDGVVGIVLAELRDSGVFQVGKGEALRSALRQEVADQIRHQGEEWPVRSGLHPDDEA